MNLKLNNKDLDFRYIPQTHCERYDIQHGLCDAFPQLRIWQVPLDLAHQGQIQERVLRMLRQGRAGLQFSRDSKAKILNAMSAFAFGINN